MNNVELSPKLGSGKGSSATVRKTRSGIIEKMSDYGFVSRQCEHLVYSILFSTLLIFIYSIASGIITKNSNFELSLDISLLMFRQFTIIAAVLMLAMLATCAVLKLAKHLKLKMRAKKS